MELIFEITTSIAEIRLINPHLAKPMVFSIIVLILLAFPVIYMYWIAVHVFRHSSAIIHQSHYNRFAIVVPAHNEEAVICETLLAMKAFNYPKELFDIFVVADHCSDQTPKIAREAGVICFERNEEPRGSKGSALNWLLSPIRFNWKNYDAVVVFDADNRPDHEFLIFMDTQLQLGKDVVQGRTIILNSEDGWVPGLYWAIETVETRLQQLGRSDLGLSAKISGYGFCVRKQVLIDNQFPTGLTEDYEYRLALLLKGIVVFYEPRAIVYSEAPTNWKAAQQQQLRWRIGIRKNLNQYRFQLLYKFVQTHHSAQLDGFFQTVFPPYSSLIVLLNICLLVQIFTNILFDEIFPPTILLLWVVTILAMFLYPLIAMIMERAPLRGYLIVIIGPIFVMWRTWQTITTRFGRETFTWIRTPRRVAK